MSNRIGEISTIEFISTFTEEYCYEYLTSIKYPNGVACPHCGSLKVYRTNRGFKCGEKECYKKFSLLARSIFSNKKIPLKSWFYLIYMNSINKKNISSVQIAKNMGIEQCAAWGAQHKLRKVFYQSDEKLSGIVEIDEAFCSKGTQWTRWGGISTRKEPIIGLKQRGGRVIIKEIPNRNRATIISIIEKYVETGSTIYTDGWAGYKKLPSGYKHDYVEHSTHEYVRGDVHTNSIENVWSFFKKNIRNGHHSISAKHIQLYLDETAYKHNNRHLTQLERFDDILKRCIFYE